MNDRETKIAQAALRMYVDKGVRRTTMSDIAREAGVTRQTVYNVFPNTDAVLRGAILYYIDGLWKQIATKWKTCATLEEKLDVLLLHFAVEPWDFLKSSPEAAELEHGFNEVGRSAIAEARLAFRGEIAKLFMPMETELIAMHTSPIAVADFISAAIEGIKYNNHTRDDMLLAVATLKACVLAMRKR